MGIKNLCRYSLDQIIKYALYQSTYKNKNTITRQNYLIFLTQSKEALFKEKFALELINKELLRHEFSDSILAWMKRNEIRPGQHWEREDVIVAVDNLTIRHCTYSAFYDFLKCEINDLNESPGDVTLKNLINGVISELENRKLL